MCSDFFAGQQYIGYAHTCDIAAKRCGCGDVAFPYSLHSPASVCKSCHGVAAAALDHSALRGYAVLIVAVDVSSLSRRCAVSFSY